MLQLKAQLLWAWVRPLSSPFERRQGIDVLLQKSCERLEKTLGLQQEGAAEPAAGPAPAESRVC